ncbi:MAG TPA: helix-turn-helix domain-containing protein, partial [Pseudolysinimonas sp.]|nr:helix-turn-helix domain-containing protein [Pseudolysinimonas sp.]
MNDELDVVELRAARHAALADSTRLRIVDLLTMGDASPSELQDRFAVPSNLMAHHLSVLHE